MKLYGALFLIVAVIMLVCPLAAVPSGEAATDELESEAETVTESEKSASAQGEGDVISVFMSEENKAQSMPFRDYIIGALGAEMPAVYSEEALKAQAAAAVTFAVYMQRQGGDKSLEGADISDDSSRHQGYMSKEEMQEKWGDAFESYYTKLAAAADAVLDKVIVWEGEPIMAAYHAISSGKTESAQNVWGRDIPYLRSVDSEGDKLSPRFSSSVSLSEQQVKNAIEGKGNADLSMTGESAVKINNTTEAGTVGSVTVYGAELTGMEARELFGLRSPVFTLSYADGYFNFDVKGYGHGVGMSQYGADYYAKQGMSWEEIIKHYYTGVSIESRADFQ